MELLVFDMIFGNMDHGLYKKIKHKKYQLYLQPKKVIACLKPDHMIPHN